MECSRLTAIVELLVKELATLKEAKSQPMVREDPGKSQLPLKPTEAPKAALKSSFKAALLGPKAATSEPKVTERPMTSATPADPADPAAWTKVGPKKVQKPVSKTAVPTLSQALKQASTKEEKLKLLLKQPISPEMRCDKVSSLMVELPLSTKAQKTPLSSWRSAITALTGLQPLAISLIHPRKAEVFFGENVIDSVTTSLSSAGYCVPLEPLTGKDIARRKTSYLQGYFRPLRRAMLQGFNRVQQGKLLDIAELSCKTVIADTLQRKQWLNHCLRDREWLQEIAANHPENDINAME
jgi:hypothetical protein